VGATDTAEHASIVRGASSRRAGAPRRQEPLTILNPDHIRCPRKPGHQAPRAGAGRNKAGKPSRGPRPGNVMLRVRPRSGSAGAKPSSRP